MAILLQSEIKSPGQIKSTFRHMPYCHVKTILFSGSEIVLIWSFPRLLLECHWLADSAPCQIRQNRNSQVCAKEEIVSQF